MRITLSERFRGLFWTQLLGAFNDNFFKQALLILIVFQGFGGVEMRDDKLSELALAIFTVPFFLLSATAGQIADKYEKAVVIQRLKVIELIIAVVATIGLFLESVPLLFVALGLLGVQSAFFGPLKYGIIPQLLDEKDLTTGNAAVETGTKLAILIGTLAGGVLAINSHAKLYCSMVILAVAVAGFLMAKQVPLVGRSDPNLKIDRNPFTPTFKVIKMARRTRSVFLSILGVSWFWALGGGLLALLPVYGKEVLQVGPDVVNFFQAVFSIGVAIGAVICGKLSRQRVELGLVPFGSIGISLFLADLALLGSPFQLAAGEFMPLKELFNHSQGWRVLIDFAGIAAASGLYIVPLYTMIQQRTDESIRSRVIAANNVINAGVMAIAVLVLSQLGDQGLTIIGKFGLLAFLNLAVGLYIYTLIPEFFLRFLAYILNHIIYRVDRHGEEHIPREGAALMVGNHVSFIDWLVVLGTVQRPVRFVMWHRYYDIPLFRFLFRDAGAIPIASGKTDPELLQKALDIIDESLAAGRVVCVFPEGQLTPDGEIGEFKRGLERILERRQVPVVPFALTGLWDSIFSRQRGRQTSSYLKRLLRPRVGFTVGSSVTVTSAQAVSGFSSQMRGQVEALRGDQR